MFRQAFQNGASDRPDAFAAATIAALIDKVCLEIMEFDFRCRHGTTTTHAPHSSPKVAWDMTSTRCQIGRSRAPAPSRAAAHLVIKIKKLSSLSTQPETR